MLECLDDAALRRRCEAGLAALRRHQREIDELNVYPVPGGDTGTNWCSPLRPPSRRWTAR